MTRFLLLLMLVAGLLPVRLLAADDPVTFKSDVALSRVDAQVLDRQGRTVTGLQERDFTLRVDGQVVPIRNFASENMPLDVLLLLDVSGSMEPHVERIASAAQQALDVLSEKDRVAVMVFDTTTRVRLPFRSSHSEITDSLRHIIRSEGFNGGTRITSAMLQATRYLQREARPDARRAIVILTDDETQDAEDEAHVESALASANSVLSFLQAPYELPQIQSRGGGGQRRGGTWGGGGGGIGFPGGGGGWPGGGGVGFPGGGGGGPVIMGGGDRSHTAGTAEIAEYSGGDTMPVDDASSLADTLARLRQRYSFNFYLPDNPQQSGGDQRNVRVDLSQNAKIMYQNAEIHYRQVFVASAAKSGERAGPTVVTRTHDSGSAGVDAAYSSEISPAGASSGTSSSSAPRAHTAVNEDSTEHVNMIEDDSDSSSGGSAGSSSSPSSSSPAAAQPKTAPPSTSGWKRATPQTTAPPTTAPQSNPPN